MAPRQAKRNVQKRPRGIKTGRPQLPSRKSARLEEIQRRQERTVSKDRNTEPKHPLPSPTSKTPGKEIKDRKRKRSQEDELTLPSNTIGENAAVGDSGEETNLLEYWRREFRWPKEYFELESDVIPGSAAPSPTTTPSDQELTEITPSDQRPRQVRSTPYQHPGYELLLESKGTFMQESDLDISDTSKTVCRTLLEAEQIVPEDSLFRDDVFHKTREMIRNRNEAKVIQDIARLIVPSAQSLAIRGAKSLETLTESVNEGWNNSISLTGTRPQPDYAVGFKRTAFTEDQLQRMQPVIGDFLDISFFMGTMRMYFPFLTCEVECGAGQLSVADRQNAHSMTLAVRGVVELFRLVKREKELHREILAFSISHNDEMVKIYGHYPVIDGNKTTFYRHPIREFVLESKEKWTAYTFTRNVYDTWMPTHLKRICSVIDELPPDLNFEDRRGSS
ncbi:hypothetical protein B0T17DRAFT_593504 [Bombardia bombarda]|uniref:DUF7924 domain-containing protein n=1 Tax=Bombardia bombarda TaxID=252184 RepID=A0AA39TZF1_9PEZI|nr:hypothetical protein B0T17DRAFT_593504 [Bombardia bombarda]